MFNMKQLLEKLLAEDKMDMFKPMPKKEYSKIRAEVFFKKYGCSEEEYFQKEFGCSKKEYYKKSEGIIKLEPFTKNDWMGFAGVERPSDNEEPLISYVKVVDWPEEDMQGIDDRVTVIADKNGASVTGIDGTFVYDCSFK